jgi:glycosyltransferase involved in cell wall biosynthesis
MDATRRVAPLAVERAPVRVLIDGRKLFDGGIGVYTRNCISGLRALGHVVGVILTSEGAERAAAESLSWLESVTLHIDNAKRYSLDEYIGLPRRVPMRAYDLFHSPHYTLPYGIPIKKVVTVHDVIHMSHAERRLYPAVARGLIRSAVRRADAVITVSDASAVQLRKHFAGIVSHKLAVIPNSVSLLPTNIAADAEFDRPYMLSVFSTLKKHKGLTDLLIAYSSYASRTKENTVPLMLVGQGFAGSDTTIKQQIQEYGLEQFVHVLGVVPEDELNRLYVRAHALLVASIEEGFCLPVIEAHAAGTPVLMRPVPAIRELALAADVLVSDFSLQALAEGIHTIATREHDSRALLRAFQRQVSDRFAPEVTTSRLVQVYRGVLDGSAA